jgi:dTMP kinase
VPGCFVVLEGPEGAGKTTLATALAARAAAAGMDLVHVREPGGTPLAESARRVLLETRDAVTAESELFLMLAARADLVQRVIRPALDAARIVLADRYELSTFAYQIAGRGLDAAAVRSANRLATGGLTPHLTLVLDLPVGVGAARQLKAGKRRDRLDLESDAFHTRVAAAYLAVEGEAVRHLNGMLPPAELAEAAWLELVRIAVPEGS